MAIINLKEIYPGYQQDCFVEVTEEVATALKHFDCQEASYQRKRYRHKAYFSLDRADGIEKDICYASVAPDEIYERKVTCGQLHSAMAKLTGKQAKRIYAYFFLGMSKAEIARAEGVKWDAVNCSITEGLKKIEKLLKMME